MQYLILGLALLFSSTIGAQSSKKEQVDQGRTIKVAVVNALSDKGTVEFAFYNESGFLKEPLFTQSASIKEGQSFVVFTGIKSGNYAVVCFHDENENNQMDFEVNGMPKENYGTSNNPMNYGPPQFEDSKFEVTNEDLTLEIKF